MGQANWKPHTKLRDWSRTQRQSSGFLFRAVTNVSHRKKTVPEAEVPMAFEGVSCMYRETNEAGVITLQKLNQRSYRLMKTLQV